MNKIFYIICILFLCSSCQLSNDKIADSWWKAGDGNAGLSDVIRFKKNDYYKLRNDTIFRNNNAVAIITKKEFRFYASNILTVKSLISDKTGTFYEQ